MSRVKKDKPSMKQFLPWIEKYRPRNIDDIAHQAHVVSTLRKSLESANLPHLLFYGPPGTGKTSTILALARQLYGPNMMKHRVLELNASDERGINVVRHKIKSFAQYSVSSSNAKANNNNNNTMTTNDKDKNNNNNNNGNMDDSDSDNENNNNNKNNDKSNDNSNNDNEMKTNDNSNNKQYPCPPYKIIILDEADSMTRDAQTALRRTMERYSNVTRFCLICNYVSRIIAPVASRCAKFRFESLTHDSMANKLTEIAEKEAIKLRKDTINEIIEISNGDMRKSITLLQSASLMRPKNESITVDDVLTVSVRVPKKIMENDIIKACRSNTFQDINNACQFVISEGYPVSLVLNEILQFIINGPSNYNNSNNNNNNNNGNDTEMDDSKNNSNDASPKTNDNNNNNNGNNGNNSNSNEKVELFTNLQKAKIALKIGKADKNLVDGASEFLQLLDVMACIGENIKKM